MESDKIRMISVLFFTRGEKEETGKAHVS